MDKKFTEQLEKYAVSIENLVSIIDIASDMISEAAWGKMSDDKENLEKYMGHLVALMDSISEIAHKRNEECEGLLHLCLKG